MCVCVCGLHFFHGGREQLCRGLHSLGTKRFTGRLNLQARPRLQVYYVYGFALLVLLILLIVAACVSVVGSYFLLNSGTDRCLHHTMLYPYCRSPCPNTCTAMVHTSTPM